MREWSKRLWNMVETARTNWWRGSESASLLGKGQGRRTWLGEDWWLHASSEEGRSHQKASGDPWAQSRHCDRWGQSDEKAQNHPDTCPWAVPQPWHSLGCNRYLGQESSWQDCCGERDSVTEDGMLDDDAEAERRVSGVMMRMLVRRLSCPLIKKIRKIVRTFWKVQ